MVSCKGMMNAERRGLGLSSVICFLFFTSVALWVYLGGKSSSTRTAKPVTSAARAILQEHECFSARYRNIEDIRVGQRVITDGGVANSADGKTRALDMNTTRVDSKTWRMVTIAAGDWQVQTLEPLVELEEEDVCQGHQILLSDIVDLEEMGVPDDLTGTITSIVACPEIESGPGRVVLATVSHPSDSVLHLRLTTNDGRADAIGVTAYHRIYSEERGWIAVNELRKGEKVRTAAGKACVATIEPLSKTLRVFNLAVEEDHVYFVGGLDALVHNNCAKSRRAYKDSNGKVFPTSFNAAPAWHVRGSGRGGVWKYGKIAQNELRDLQAKWVEKMWKGGMSRAEVEGRIRAAGASPRTYKELLDSFFG